MNTEPVLLQAEAAAWDQATIHSGLDSRFLMAWAGQALFFALSNTSQFNKATTVIMILGNGNNAGDGYVLAWHLLQLCEKKIYIFYAEPKSENCLYFYNLIAAKKSEFLSFFPLSDIFQILPNLADLQNSILVEGLLGLGLSRPLSNEQNHLIEKINLLKIFRIAIDIPAGLGANGEIFGTVFKADQTYTFGAYKIGQLIAPGISFCGDISVLPVAFQKTALPHTNRRLANTYPISILRHSNAHKYTSGVCHIFGGSQGMEGAAILAAKSFLALGGGLAKIYSYSQDIKSALNSTPELMIKSGTDCAEDFLNTISSLKGKRIGVIGPGLSEPLSGKFWSSLFEIENLYLIIDGSALRQIREHEELFKNRKHGWIMLTPHAGEATALDSAFTTTVREKTQNIAERYAATVYYKGAGSFLIIPEKHTTHEIFFGAGSSALATGGTGDILCGVIANLFSRFDNPAIAAEAAIDLYIKAACKTQSGISDFLTASELIEGLRKQILKAQD